MSADNSTLVVPQFPEIPGVEFRLIPGFPGYAADSEGRIWSCKRGKWRERRTHPMPRTGHRILCLHVNGKPFSGKVHQLVLLAFEGPRPDGMECCHFPDRDPANNRPSNLMWGTRKQNVAHARIHGTLRNGGLRGERHPAARLTEAQVRELRALAGTMQLEELGRRYGIGSSEASLIARGKAWRCVDGPVWATFKDRLSRRGESNPSAKLTYCDVCAIRERYAKGEIQVALAMEYGVTQNLISKIVTGRIWKHGPT